MDRVVDILLRIYPIRFRRRFGEDIRVQLRLDLAEAKKRGTPRWVVAASGLLWDLAMAGIRERLDSLLASPERRQGARVRAPWMASLRGELRHALRNLGRRPGSTGASVVILAMGVLVNVGVFGMALATLFPRIHGVKEPAGLISLFQYNSERGYYSSLSLPAYRDYRESMGTLRGLAAYSSVPANLTVGPESYRITAQLVSPDYFRVLGVEPSVGRGFLSGSVPSDGHSTVLAYDTWQRFFGGRSDILGTAIRLGRESFTVVGVSPPKFRGLDLESPASVWVTLDAREAMTPYSEDMVQGRGMHWLSAVGRLAPGATRSQVSSEAKATAAALGARFPEVQGGWEARVRPLSEAVIWPEQRDGIRRVTLMLGAVVFLILMLACVTLASMELAHIAVHQEEAAVRLALGAGRWHLMRQQLTQALLITLAALAIGFLGGALVTGLTPIWTVIPQLPAGLDLQPDWRLLAGAAILIPILFVVVGALPALQAGRAEPAAAMRTHRTGGPRGVGRLRKVLSAIQVGISVAVLSAAGTLMGNAKAQLSHDLGFDPSGVLLASVDPQLSGYDKEERSAFYQRTKELVEDLPGVRSAAVSAFVPFTGPRLGADVQYRDPGGVERTYNVTGNIVSPDYFRTMGIALVQGHDLAPSDPESATPVVLNEAAAKEFWGSGDPLGRELDLGPFLGGQAVVVGVARDMGAGRGLYESPRPSVFVPISRDPWTSATIHLRIQGSDPRALAGPLRGALASVDPSVPLYDVRTLQSVVDSALAPSLATAEAVGLLGILGLLLAAAGIYGVVAQSVSRRLPEFGIRIAVGAARENVLAQVLREGGVVFAGGLILGIPGAFLLAHLLRRMLFGVEPFAPATLGAAVALTAAATFVALLLPARRATAVDPVEALRRL